MNASADDVVVGVVGYDHMAHGRALLSALSSLRCEGEGGVDCYAGVVDAHLSPFVMMVDASYPGLGMSFFVSSRCSHHTHTRR